MKTMIATFEPTAESLTNKLQSLTQAYNFASQEKTLSVKEIQAYIVENYGKYTNEKIALDLGVDLKKIAGNVAALIRKGVIVSDTVKTVKKTKKVLTIKESNTYSNADGENKQKARIKMVNRITNSGVTGTILTLPHIKCTIEKMVLAENTNIDFIGCEIDKPTYNGMNKTIRTEMLPIKTHYGPISDKIYGVESDTYAHMILDYCGSIVTFDKEFRYSIQNNLVKVNGVISITFNKRGHADPKNIIKVLASTLKNYEDGRGEMERGVEAYFHKVLGFNYEIIEIFNYKDDGKSPMMLVQIKRVK